ncbi:MAG: phosphate acetyltransferase, partial [Butyrivibrio sp.]|nr:phosphate acetyltransferase [Butyrivibrio sp.]
PILLGLNAPINDLSRGCNAIEVYSMAIITAALA